MASLGVQPKLSIQFWRECLPKAQARLLFLLGFCLMEAGQILIMLYTPSRDLNPSLTHAILSEAGKAIIGIAIVMLVIAPFYGVPAKAKWFVMTLWAFCLIVTMLASTGIYLIFFQS